MPLGQAWLGPTCAVRGTSRVGPLSIDAAGGRARLWRLHFLWLIMIGLNLPVLANAKTDKPEHQQDGSGYHHPIRIFHRREHAH